MISLETVVNNSTRNDLMVFVFSSLPYLLISSLLGFIKIEIRLAVEVTGSHLRVGALLSPSNPYQLADPLCL